jgi:hypothetical protein
VALAEEIQAYIVQAHAAFRKPALIVRDVKAEFGVDVRRETALFYHPERGSKTKRLAKKWKVLFAETRAAFLANQVQIGIAHQAYRVQLYQRAADFYEQQGNFVLATEMAERAAKEIGGAFTNRREHSGPHGKPIEVTPVTLEQWKEQAAARRAQAGDAVRPFAGDGDV